MRERTFTSFRESDSNVAVLDAPPRQKLNADKAEEFAAAARKAIQRALSADSETFLQATRQTSGQ